MIRFEPTPFATDTHKTVARYLLVLTTINIFVLGAISWSLFSSYQMHAQMAAAAAENMSNVLEEGMTRFIDKVDLTLLAVVDEIKREQSSGGIDSSTLDAFLTRNDARIPEALGLRVVDQNGIVTNAVTNILGQNIDMSHAGSFIHSSTTDDNELFISSPYVSPLSGRASIGLSRRLTDSNGHFAGQVHAGVAIKQLADMFSATKLSGHSSVTLTDPQARVIARAPDLGDEASLVKTPTILPTMHRLIAEGRSSSGYRTVSAVDNIERSYFFRQVRNRQLFLLVGVADDDYFAGWRQECAVMMSLYGLFLILSSLAAAMLLRDWRQRAAATAELMRKEAALTLFRQAIDRSNDAILIVDPDTASLFDFNQTACEQLGYSREELSHLNLKDIDTEVVDQPSWEKLRSTLLEQSDGLLFKRVHRRRNGETFPVEISWRTVEIHGQRLGISVERDVTEKLRTESDIRVKAAELERSNAALLQSNADLERFAYVASHDLQTPLSNIIHFTQLLERHLKTDLDGDSRDYLHFIIDGGRRMSQLISDLLQYARVTSQAKPLELVSTHDALELALNNLADPIAETGALVDVGDLPQVIADSTQLVSLFQNLIGNAIKYRHGSRRLRIAVRAEPASDQFWKISVCDNGTGIPLEYHEKVFEIFQRLNQLPAIDGTGIGLTICQRIVRRFGGEIWIEHSDTDGPDAGTTISFTLSKKS